jgi:hypothetical protein
MHYALVVGGPEGGEECGRNGEEGEVFDVGVTVNGVVSIVEWRVEEKCSLLRWVVCDNYVGAVQSVRHGFTSDKANLR